MTKIPGSGMELQLVKETWTWRTSGAENMVLTSHAMTKGVGCSWPGFLDEKQCDSLDEAVETLRSLDVRFKSWLQSPPSRECTWESSSGHDCGRMSVAGECGRFIWTVYLSSQGKSVRYSGSSGSLDESTSLGLRAFELAKQTVTQL